MEYKCICGKEFTNNRSLGGHKAKCKIYYQRLNEIFDKEQIIEWIKEKSSNSFADMIYIKYNIKIAASAVITYCKNHGIKTMTIKEANSSEYVREKYKNTCLEKYGTENALSYGTKSYKKRNKTVKRKYGVDNVFQLQETKEKSKVTCLKKYGTEYPCTLSIKNVGKTSVPQKIVEEWLDKNNITYYSECNSLDTRMFNTYLNRFYKPRPDIYIPEINLIIEVYGDRWHANPKVFLDDDIIYKWKGEQTAKTIRETDKAREQQLNAKGFNVIVIWASDISKNNKTEVLKKLIKEIEWKRSKLNLLEESTQKPDTIYL